MRLFKKDNINDYIIPKDLSIGATGMLNSLLIRTNDELENTNLYSLSNDKEISKASQRTLNKDISGIRRPFSQLDIARSVTPTILASSCCVKPFSFRTSAKNLPIFS